MGRKYGYMRVSSEEQNSDRQKQALLDQGINKNMIFEDKISGKDFNRPEYTLLKEKILREGDTLFIKELDRLGRNARLIKKEWEELMEMGVSIVVLDMSILDTREYKNGMEEVITNIVLELLSYMAEKERENIRKRQREGIKQAKKQGKHLGRPRLEMPDDFGEYYKKVYIDDEMKAVEAMKEMELTKTKFYDFKKQYEKENDMEIKNKF